MKTLGAMTAIEFLDWLPAPLRAQVLEWMFKARQDPAGVLAEPASGDAVEVMAVRGGVRLT